MLKLVTTKQFEKDYKKILRSGKGKDETIEVIKKLVNEENLERKYSDHKLKGIWSGRRECHIKPDLLLIYKKDKDRIIMERLGSHSVVV